MNQSNISTWAIAVESVELLGDDGLTLEQVAQACSLSSQWLINRVHAGVLAPAAALAGADESLSEGYGEDGQLPRYGLSSTLLTAEGAAALAGDARKAAAIHLRLLPLHKQLFVEANPIPVKWAMARMGLMGGAMRLPMTPLSAANEPVVERALNDAGLL